MALATADTAPTVGKGTGALVLDPITRVGGGLGARVAHDGETITDAHLCGTSYRGYEPIITARDPRDVMMLASRACGWCGGVNMTTASMALEMAWGLRLPPMGHALRNVAQATEQIWVHAAHLAVRAGPDWCGPVVRATTPWLWDEATKAEAPHAKTHGFGTIGDLMEAMTPGTGSYWLETIPTGRRVLEMINMLFGKYPHPSNLTPGGVGTNLTVGSFTEYYTRLYRSVDYVKRLAYIWDDLCDFLADADPRFAEQGVRPASFVHAGCFDDPEAADGSYERLDEYAALRHAVPGVMLDGRLETDRLTTIAQGITESVARSFYDPWSEQAGADPLGNPLPSGHPWTKTTVPRPQARDYDGAYSWSTAPRWNDRVVESTPLGRLWLTALRDSMPPNGFIESTGSSVRILVPVNFLPETVLEWRIPERANMLERLRADAYGVAFAGLCAANALLKGFELLRSYRTGSTVPFDVVDEEVVGAGLWESGRGMCTHWLRTGKRVDTFQIVGPSTWNASPRDGAGQPGPIEEALLGSPLVEEAGAAGYHGIDATRIIHSFDPCMTCATH